MAETWKTRPPYPNWKAYADSLSSYVDNLIAKTGKLNGISLAEWYRQNEAELRHSPEDRRKNSVVANALLPLLWKNPQHWNTVRFLNLSDPQEKLTFQQYLRDWHQRVPPSNRSFVEQVAALFEIVVR
jgi:hypothetical protein